MIENLDEIRNILLNNGVIAFVTDTVWGIGCLPESEIAVNKIYDIKARDRNKPLILMSSNLDNLYPYVTDKISDEVNELLTENLPGAFTMVLPKSEKVPDFVTSGFDTVGIRVPDCDVFAEICESIPNKVLATTSANLSNEPPALTYQEAIEYVGDKVDMVVYDYGFQADGKPSKVVGYINNEVKVFRA